MAHAMLCGPKVKSREGCTYHHRVRACPHTLQQSNKAMARKSSGGATSPRRPATGAGATTSSSGGSSKGNGDRLAVGRSFLSTFWGAALAGFLGYLVGFFAQNDRTTPGETYRRLLRCVGFRRSGSMCVGGGIKGCWGSRCDRQTNRQTARQTDREARDRYRSAQYPLE
jgi:hypothetical protein